MWINRGQHAPEPQLQGIRQIAHRARAEIPSGHVSGAVPTLIEGDVDTAKAVLRDYINATIGFPALAEATKMPPKSLMRMFGPNGNRPP
jgi:hypothetical protein